MRTDVFSVTPGSYMNQSQEQQLREITTYDCLNFSLFLAGIRSYRSQRKEGRMSQPQRHVVVNLDRYEYFRPEGLNVGATLDAQVYAEASTPQALFLLLTACNGRGKGGVAPDDVIGRWVGDRVVVIGDQATRDDGPKGHKFDTLFERLLEPGEARPPRTVKPAGQISSRTGEVCRPCKRGGERRMRADAAAYVDITEDLLPMMSSVFALEIVHEAETAEVETAEVEADEVETEETEVEVEADEGPDGPDSPVEVETPELTEAEEEEEAEAVEIPETPELVVAQRVPEEATAIPETPALDSDSYADAKDFASLLDLDNDETTDW
jgi:hypothetical protein